jgi:hypothetical protein
MKWYRWTLKREAIDAVVPPCLEEDEDDQAYSIRNGLVVVVCGSFSGYMICGRPHSNVKEKDLIERLNRLLTHPFYAPLKYPDSNATTKC